jgi:hypothetical protein
MKLWNHLGSQEKESQRAVKLCLSRVPSLREVPQRRMFFSNETHTSVRMNSMEQSVTTHEGFPSVLNEIKGNAILDKSMMDLADDMKIWTVVEVLLLLLALQPIVDFSLLGDFLTFSPFFTLLSPLSYSHYMQTVVEVTDLIFRTTVPLKARATKSGHVGAKFKKFRKVQAANHSVLITSKNLIPYSVGTKGLSERLSETHAEDVVEDDRVRAFNEPEKIRTRKILRLHADEFKIFPVCVSVQTL